MRSRAKGIRKSVDRDDIKFLKRMKRSVSFAVDSLFGRALLFYFTNVIFLKPSSVDS
jgi:hypothetical protein